MTLSLNGDVARHALLGIGPTKPHSVYSYIRKGHIVYKLVWGDMRIWDIPPKELCYKHLLGEHRELHAIWAILVDNKYGYSRHPETLRWKGKLKALYNKHTELVKELYARGYNHRSPLNLALATGSEEQDVLIDSIYRQRVLLYNKNCECKPITLREIVENILTEK